jgi:hypothetical protein
VRQRLPSLRFPSAAACIARWTDVLWMLILFALQAMLLLFLLLLQQLGDTPATITE